MSIITVMIQKGGTGKTTTVSNIAVALAMLGKKVLLVDMDPQHDLSSIWDMAINTKKQAEEEVWIWDLLTKQKVNYNKVVKKVPGVENLGLIRNGEEFRDMQYQEMCKSLKDGKGNNAHQYLRNHLKKLKPHFDYILIDTPPARTGMLILNSCVAADYVIIPTEVEKRSVRAVGIAKRNIEIIRKQFNPKLKLAGVLPIKFDSRRAFHKQYYKDLMEEYKPKNQFFQSWVPLLALVHDAEEAGTVVVQLDPWHTASLRYKTVAEEIVERFS